MIKIAICDDEQDELDTLQAVINQYGEEKEISLRIDVFNKGEELLSNCADYDVIFLDIYMGGMTGIDTAKSIRQKDKQVEIIFITGHIGLTKEALAVHAFEYLDKPVSRELIYRQMDEVLEKITQNKPNYAVKKETVEFNTGRGTVSLTVDDIYYFERYDRKIKAVTNKGVYILNDTITSLEQKFRKYDFVMPHQSFVVNINHMQDYFKDEIIMTNYDTIPVAQKRSPEFKKVMRDFLQKQMERNL